jgi:hypothetical protein
MHPAGENTTTGVWDKSLALYKNACMGNNLAIRSSHDDDFQYSIGVNN